MTFLGLAAAAVFKAFAGALLPTAAYEHRKQFFIKLITFYHIINV